MPSTHFEQNRQSELEVGWKLYRARIVLLLVLVSLIGGVLVACGPAIEYPIDVLQEQGTGIYNGGRQDKNIIPLLNRDSSYNGVGSYALGQPDGFPAIIYGVEGNFVTLKIFDKPEYVKSISVYLNSLYSYIVNPTFRVDVSLDETNWDEVFTAREEISPGTSKYEIIVNQKVLLVRVIQRKSGVNLGIDSVEIVR